MDLDRNNIYVYRFVYNDLICYDKFVIRLVKNKPRTRRELTDKFVNELLCNKTRIKRELVAHKPDEVPS